MGANVAIIGAGGMGTACSVLLAEHADQDVSLWTANTEHADAMRRERENVRLLPGVKIPPRVLVTADIAEATASADLLLVAVPTVYLRDALERIKEHLKLDRPVISVVKGLENETFLRPSEIICEVLGQRAVVALSGPSHAEEISRHLPATVVAASGDLALAKRVQHICSTERFRVYTNTDIIGVELAAALKNIVAIAAGVCDGLQFGDNAKAALLTRGLVEMVRFGTALGAERNTFFGLAGIGDLITTCQSPYGRNRSVGEALGKGKKLDEIISGMEAVAEGVATTRSVHDLAERRGIDMPITAEVYRVLFEGKDPLEAVRDLMLRPHKAEME
jgi:glycerol-3-phosphate dehydrogenase (NAD(P)+)